jgi:dinuclear metal center YbgI/SA1388 family protein
MLNVATICSFLDDFAPPKLAADWDNVGLLLGDHTTKVERLLTCLTITPEVVEEAVAEKANLIVTHHPILFRGTKRLSTYSSEGRLLMPLIHAGVAVYSPHTSFDNTVGGINDSLAQRIGLTEVRPLRWREGNQQYKITVFTPEKDLEPVSEAMFKAGAGHIGQYHHCSFRIPGTGTFFGSDSTNPTVGQKGRLETVAEIRLEIICSEGALNNVLGAMRKAHSYEEPAFDVYPLRPNPDGGEGRMGRLAKAEPLKTIGRRLKKSLKASVMQMVGDEKTLIQKVAVVCGAGGEYLQEAIRARCDLFITGEMRFHDLLIAKASDVALLIPGHYATERPGIEELADRLQEKFPEVQVWTSTRETDPLQKLD